jgi:hypothetical protein
MTLTPRRRKGLALLLAWAGVSVLFFSLSRPVREWAGHHWIHYVLGAAMLTLLASAGAWQLWERR